MDLDGDGQSEMLVGSQIAGKNYFFTGLYYLKEGQPTLLAEGYVAGHGGARSSMKFFKTGEVLALTWSSGSGEGEGTLYKLEGAKGPTKVDSKSIKITDKKLLENFGKSEADEVTADLLGKSLNLPPLRKKRVLALPLLLNRKQAVAVQAVLAVHRVKARKRSRKRLLPKQKKPALGQLINLLL